MWFFDSPKIIFGEDALSHLEQIEGKKCFIVTDPGIIKAKRGKSYVIKIKDQNKEKSFIIEPIHLKKIKQTKK